MSLVPVCARVRSNSVSWCVCVCGCAYVNSVGSCWHNSHTIPGSLTLWLQHPHPHSVLGVGGVSGLGEEGKGNS